MSGRTPFWEAVVRNAVWFIAALAGVLVFGWTLSQTPSGETARQSAPESLPNQRALAAFKNKLYDRAVEFQTEWVADYPQDAEAWWELGRYRAKIGDADGAEQARARAMELQVAIVEIYEDDPAEWIRLGRFYESLREPELALDAWSTASDLVADKVADEGWTLTDWRAFEHIWEHYARLGDASEIRRPVAERCAASVDQRSQPRDWYVLGWLWQLESEHELARQAWSAAVSRQQRLLTHSMADRKGWYNLACYAALAVELDTVIDALEHAIDAGFSDVGQLRRDSRFDAVRTEPRFVALVQRLNRSRRASNGP